MVGLRRMGRGKEREKGKERGGEGREQRDGKVDQF